MYEINLESSEEECTAKQQGDAVTVSSTTEKKEHPETGDTYDILSEELVAIPKCPTGIEMLNRHSKLIFEQIYYAIEESDSKFVDCCERKRSYTIHVVNNFNQEVIYIKRPLKPCAGCCCWCPLVPTCYQRSYVYLSDGTLLGSIKEACTFCSRKYCVYDSDDKKQLIIRGRICCAAFDGRYKILNMRGKKIGYIRKFSAGMFRDLVLNETNFGVTCKLFLLQTPNLTYMYVR
uniref:Phospholipid scramblase n=1 Tax=Syphacia muris TaxID=451379 RepID=A0A0N5AU43_9BILA